MSRGVRQAKRKQLGIRRTKLNTGPFIFVGIVKSYYSATIMWSVTLHSCASKLETQPISCHFQNPEESAQRVARLNSVFLEIPVARDPRDPDLLSRSHSCFSTVFNSQLAGVSIKNPFIHQPIRMRARQRQGPKLVLHRYFESAQQEKQLLAFSSFGPFGWCIDRALIGTANPAAGLTCACR